MSNSLKGIIIVLKHFLKSEYLQIIFFPSHDLSSFPLCPFDSQIFLIHLLCSFIFLWFLTIFLYRF